MTEKYHCPSCNISMSTSIKLSTPPVHQCPKKANRTVPLISVKEEDKEKTPTE